MEIRVEGIKYPLYMRSQDKPELDEILSSDEITPGTAILVPLDNLLWDRKLIKALFDFEYIWEVYKPGSERLGAERIQIDSALVQREAQDWLSKDKKKAKTFGIEGFCLF